MLTDDEEQPPPTRMNMNRSKGPVPREGPAWVDSFLAGEYFTNCNFHTSGKNERNMFCTDCNEGPLCQFGMITNHAGHKTLQVRKASHMDSIRVVDIQQRLQVSDIQTYSINSAKIVFLLSRPQPRPSKGAPHACRCCNRALPDDAKFCSLACKLDVLREESDDRSITFALPEGGGEQDRECCEEQVDANKLLQQHLRSDAGSCSEQVVGGESPSTPEKSECSSSKSRCRKGVPRRAPLR